VHAAGDSLERSATDDGKKIADEDCSRCYYSGAAAVSPTSKNAADGRVDLMMQGSCGGDTFSYGQLTAV